METKENELALIQRTTERLLKIQGARNLSDSALVQEYPDLKSAKTWKNRMVKREYTGIKWENLVERCRRISIILDGGTPNETYHPDSPFALELRLRLQLLEKQTNDRRILCVLAAPGTGKSSFTRWACNQRAADRVAMRVKPTWRNRPLHLCTGICAALGVVVNTTQPSEAEQRLIELLQTPRTVFIDQAHEGGVALMHLLRALVDETPSRFVFEAYETAYKRVVMGSSDAMIEAQAFLGRCLKPIFNAYRNGILPEDVAFHLGRSGLDEASAQSVARKITPTLQQQTNLRLLEDAILKARGAAESDEATPEQIETWVFKLAGVDPRNAAAQPDEVVS